MQELLKNIKEYNEFLTYEELKQKVLGITDKDSLLNLGTSSDNKSIFGCKIGQGEKNALIFGFPHPNEPVGSLTCVELIKLLHNNEELRNKYTWYIIPCADPFGARMNEGWFKGGFDITKYAYNFYRPEAERQIEWSFPVRYKDFSFQQPCPETKILADLIDEIRPDIIYPLHNAGIGGAYFYLTREMPAQFYESVRNLCEELQIPLDYGEPEEEFIKEQTKPFYWEFDIEQMYEYLKNLGKDPRKIIDGGNNSIGYATNQNPDLFGLIGEIPYIYDEKIIDTSDSGQKRKKLLEEKYALQEQLIGFIAENIEKGFIERDNALYLAVKKMSNMMLEMTNAFKEDLDNPEYNQNATIAEKFSSQVAERFHLCTFLGEFYRLLSLSNQSEEIRKLKSQTEEMINEQINFIEQNSAIKTIPIKNLVRLQLGTLLEAIKYV